MENISPYLYVLFCITTLLTVFLFVKGTRYSRVVIIGISAWLILQSVVALTEFYTNTNSIPPRFTLAVLPPMLLIATLFIFKKGRNFIHSLDMRTLTLLHVIRIPVEICLYYLFLQKTIPELMTFEGRNLDILSGITAPVVYYFAFVKKTLGRRTLLVWNFICLALLINIVSIAIVTAPFPFQQLAFDQPNIAVLYFPFIWLPACIVPLVLLSHLVCIKNLLSNKAGSLSFQGLTAKHEVLLSR
jgi:hypothetical protein